MNVEGHSTSSSELPATLYKYTKSCVARKIVSNGTLRFSSPTDFNDPFDSQWDVFWQYTSPEGKKIERDIIREALLNPDTWPVDASQSRLDALKACCTRYKKASDSDRNTILEECIDSQCDDGGCHDENKQAQLRLLVRPLRVLCLGERHDVGLKWSHYADEHRGIVLGFDTSRLGLVGDRLLRPVQYQLNPPSLFDLQAWMWDSVYGCSTSPQQIDWDKFTHTKHIDWQYELEWRSVFRDTGSAVNYWDYPFPLVALKEVIFGCKCTQENVTSISRAVISKYPEATLYHASLHPHKFAIERSAF